MQALEALTILVTFEFEFEFELCCVLLTENKNCCVLSYVCGDANKLGSNSPKFHSYSSVVRTLCITYNSAASAPKCPLDIQVFRKMC
jgi:hypothetical protein